MISLAERQRFFTQQETILDGHRKALKVHRTELADLETRATYLEEGRSLVNDVAIVTQREISSYISDVVTLALASIYGDEYSFVAEYEIKRDIPQLVCTVRKGDLILDPRGEEVGGGVLDVCALGLRLVLWSLSRSRVPSLLLLDEPFRFVRSPGQDLMPKAAEVLKELSRMMSVQIIVATHSPELAEAADSVFVVTQADGVSSVEKRQ